MKKRAVLAGGSGFIGSNLAQSLTQQGYAVTVIGRSNCDISWNNTHEIIQALDGADLLVNLAGKPIDCRYTEANRRALLNSRLDTTRKLRTAIRNCETQPKLWCNASAASIYGYHLDTPVTEAADVGGGLLPDILRLWETEFFTDELETRRVALRFGIVIGDGPATNILLRLAKLGLGGTQYDHPWPTSRRLRGITASTKPGIGIWSGGNQRVGWIHIDDIVGIINFLTTKPEISGPINVVAPQSITNAELMAACRKATHRPIGLPAPRFGVELGMALLRKESILIFDSMYVTPQRLLEAGYNFKYHDIATAVASVTK